MHEICIDLFIGHRSEPGQRGLKSVDAAAVKPANGNVGALG
jgi:hypothetical protein